MSNIRQIFFDTETTGLDMKKGHRMAEFAGVEVINGEPTGRVLHFFLNPDREVDPEAAAVNGLSWDMLRDKPRFRDKVDELIAFIEGAELIAHNSSFDEGVIQAELERVNYSRTVWEVVGKFTDTLPLARNILRSQGLRKFKLDNLLDHYGIDRSMRDKHDALLDCKLLMPVYNQLISGVDLSRPSLEEDVPRPPVVFVDRSHVGALPLASVPADRAQAHEQYLHDMGKASGVEPLGWATKPAALRR